MAQNQMKINEDRHRCELEFEPGDFAYLRLQPFHQLTRSNMKLSPRFLQALPGVGAAQEGGLQVGLASAITDTSCFHMSQLKKKLGSFDHVAPE